MSGNKRKAQGPTLEEVLEQPWCWYCLKSCQDLKILTMHQKAKHFKCHHCNRRLNTAGGLSVHMSQVHKETLDIIENALPNRSDPNVEIFGMEGIPEADLQQHRLNVIAEYHKDHPERRNGSNNNAANGAPGPSKKLKVESTADIKKRLAEHKAARLAAEKNGGASTGSNTPTPTTANVATTQSPTASPGYGQYNSAFAPPAINTGYSQPPNGNSPYPHSGAHTPVYGAQPLPFGHVPGATPPQPLPYGQSPQQYAPPFPPPQGYQIPPAASPPVYPGQSPYAAQPYQPQMSPNGYPPQHVGARPFVGSHSPHPPQQGRTHSPLSGPPQRPPSISLPSAVGLPQRPAVAAPPVNAAQFQQMHQGQMRPTQVAGQQHGLQNGSAPSQPPTVQMPSPQGVPGASSIDELISSVSKQADADNTAVKSTAQAPEAQTASKQDGAEDKSAAKKDKEKAAKPTRMVYSDNDTAFEEKLAFRPKYALASTSVAT